MDFTIDARQQERTVRMSGQFTFADNQKFRQIVEMAREDGVQAVALDFSDVDFIDSAGLGMLLLFRDACQERYITVALAGAHGQVEKIFLLSKFDQLFSLKKAGT